MLLCVLLSQLSVAGVFYPEINKPKTPAEYKTEVRSRIEKLEGNEIKDKDVHAIDSLTFEALDKYPDNSIAHELRGRYYMLFANYNKARYHFIKALTLDKENISARQQMLNIETILGEYSSALVYLNELLEVAPYDAGLWKKKIDLYRKLGNDVEADRLTQRYMTIYTDDVKFKLAEAERKEASLKSQSVDTLGYAISERERILRDMIALQPKRPAYYYYLISYLSANARTEDALDVAGTAAYMCRYAKKDTVDDVVVDYSWFVDKRVRILCDLNRTKEAENYLLNLKKEGYAVESQLADVRLEAARAAKMNDPYEASAYIYDKTKSRDALIRLINTAIQRGYYDDALEYMKLVRNPDWRLEMKRYTVYKRMGQVSKANGMLPNLISTMPKDSIHDMVCDLMQLKINEAKDLMGEGDYRNAIRPLKELLGIDIKGVPLQSDDDIISYRESVWSHLYSCYLNRKKYQEAEVALDSLYKHYRKGRSLEYVLNRANLYATGNMDDEALSSLMEYVKINPSDSDEVSSAYEEIAIPYIKLLIDNKQISHAESIVSSALKLCPTSIDLLIYGINTAQTLNLQPEFEARVKSGRFLFPDNKYFGVKMAQLHQTKKHYGEAIATVEPLFYTYQGDSSIISVYAENCYLQIDTLLKQSKIDTQRSVQLFNCVDSLYRVANTKVPGNQLLSMARGRYFEALSRDSICRTICYKDSAYNYYRLCKGEYDTPAEYRRVTNQLYNDSRHNELSFEYQHGISGEDAARSGTAYMTYKRIRNNGDELSVGFAYAGRSGLAGSELTDYTKGGIGCQISAGWIHNFGRTFTGEIQAAWASHYFPEWTARLGATWHVKYDWDLNIHASYRKMETYSGVYKKSIFGEGYEIDHWEASDTPLLQLGVSVAKMIGSQFRVSCGVDGFKMEDDIFVNGNIKCQYYPLEGSKNHFFVSGGIGTAPDGSMLDKAHSVTFKDMNGFMSMGGYVLLTGNIGAGLAGTWNTIYIQSERPSTVITPIITEGYKNYFYINANVVIKF